MRTSIKRLYEADDIQQMPMNGQGQAPQVMPQMAPPEPVKSPSEMMPNFDFQEEQPVDQEQQMLPEPNVMNLTVKELMDRCQTINPLICMGLQQFIDSNTDAIMGQTTGDSKKMNGLDTDDVDLNFSKQMEPKSPDFSLDQPAQELDFPQD